MPRIKTQSAKAAGMLIKAIDRVWMEAIEEGGGAKVAEDKLGMAHNLLQASTAEGMRNILGKKSMQQHFGNLWIESYPKIKQAVKNLELAIEQESNY